MKTRSILSVAFCALVSSSFGQLTTLGSEFNGPTVSGGFFTQSDFSGFHSTLFGFVGQIEDAWITYRYTDPVAEMSASHTSYYLVGNTPVEVSNPNKFWDFKLVNFLHGNSGMHSELSISTSVFAFDDLDNNGVLNGGEPVVEFWSETDNIGGANYNSFEEYEGTSAVFTGLNPVVIVGPELTIGVFTQINILTTGVSNNVLGGTTLEASGGYDGFAVNFQYRAVPEPATMMVLGFGSLGVVLRRRFKKD